MLAQVSGKLYLVIGNVKTHIAACIQEFVKVHADHLELLPIPSYPSQYNQPIEGVWAPQKRAFVAMTARATCQSGFAYSGQTTGQARRYPHEIQTFIKTFMKPI
ncbi:MAG: transposase [Candidatus Sericytochromatia bacterium]